jgi:cytochrome c oxidase cbb3-type subunit 3
MNSRTIWRLLALLTVSAVGCTHVRMGFFVLRSNPRANDPTSIAQGKEAFAAHCAVCHGANADGHGQLAATLAARPTDFTAPGYTKSANRIGGHIAYGKGDAMPAFVDTLSDTTIWDIANYLHSLQRPLTAHP